jgi:hypothetical protein
MLLMVAAVLASTAAMPAQSGRAGPQASATVAGKWNVTFPGRPGVLALEIKLDGNGKTVAGTFGDQPVDGQFVDGKLTFASRADWVSWREQALARADAGDKMTTVNFATVKDENTLAGASEVFIQGYQSIRRSPWTATRVKTH